jgi:hypothetical protein
MRLPNAAEPPTAAAVNRPQDDLRAGIAFSVRESRTRRQRLIPFGTSQAVAALAFAMVRRESGPVGTALSSLAKGKP